MNFTFIDLFAGVGGFHQAMSSIGGKCVFASEIDENCREVYNKNFNMKVYGDINECIDKIPKFDVLCGGFPCQTFSKAGKQEGFNDDIKGKLFFRIIEILKKHNECKYVIMENVRNLADNKKFWNTIQKELKNLNFYVTREPLILSPDDFGIPQNRERVYILGIKKGKENKDKLKNKEILIDDLKINKYFKKCSEDNAKKILVYGKFNKSLIIDNNEKQLIKCWEDFKKNIVPNKQIGAPIWIDFFGMDIKPGDEEKFKKAYGFYYQKKSNGEYEQTPDWKKKFILRNRNLYIEKKDLIDIWYGKYEQILTNKTYRKFEWNCGPDYKCFKNCIIQFRQSGIRVKRMDKFPSLVAIVNTPIIWDKELKSYRRISVQEAKNLQSFDKNFIFEESPEKAYKQLGNSVNVEIIKYIAYGLFNLGK